MWIEIKSGARVRGLRPEMVLALLAARDVFASEGFPVVLTSGSDGRHRTTSLHYAGSAVDLRSRHLPSAASRDRVAERLEIRLGGDFDVVLEDVGGPNEHFHIEYQPKGE